MTSNAILRDRHGQLTLPKEQAVFAALVLLLAGAFFVVEHRWDYSTLQRFQLSVDDTADQLASGSTMRKIAFVGIALAGAALLFLPSPNRLNIDNWLSLFILVYLIWLFMSVAWTESPQQTLKRLTLLAFCLLGVFGVCRRLSMRQLLVMTTLVSLSYITVGLLAEFSHHTFTPWKADYRFAGTVHPNAQGTFCALLCLSAYFGFRGSSPRWKFGWLFLFLVGLCLLLLTKSRSCLIAFSLAMVACRFLTAAPKRRVAAVISTFAIIFAGMLVATLAGAGFGHDLGNAAYLGRQEGSMATLNGRVPLWESLADYARDRPLLGYGYQAFWTPARVARVSTEQGWTVPSAHSGYMEVLLSAGLIGAFIYLVFGLCALRRSARLFHWTQDPGVGLTFALLVFGMSTSFFESTGVVPVSFDSFVTGCAIGMIAFRQEQFSAPEQRERPMEGAA